MVKAPLPIAEIMSDPDLSITTTPFSPGNLIIKRASFPGGKVPDHLKNYLISPGTGKGMTGTVIYKGKPVPKTAANVAAKYK